jgi:ankyrin repeat protein
MKKKLIGLLVFTAFGLSSMAYCAMNAFDLLANTGKTTMNEAAIQMEDDGWTPLHWAAAKGDKKEVENLINSQANVNAQDVEYRTPIFYAAIGGYKQIVEMLIDNGASIKTEGSVYFPSTPLQVSATYKKEKIPSLFLSTVNELDVIGSEALCYAASMADPTMVDLLIKAGANLNHTHGIPGFPIPLPFEFTPSHWAVLALGYGKSYDVKYEPIENPHPVFNLYNKDAECHVLYATLYETKIMGYSVGQTFTYCPKEKDIDKVLALLNPDMDDQQLIDYKQEVTADMKGFFDLIQTL